MCYYCRYLAHANSSLSSDIYNTNQYIPHDLKCRRTYSYNLTISLCLASLTSFFVMLNITLVLSQPSQVQQQQREQISNRILQENTRGNKKSNEENLF